MPKTCRGFCGLLCGSAFNVHEHCCSESTMCLGCKWKKTWWNPLREAGTVACYLASLLCCMGLPQWHSGKESTCNAGDTGDASSMSGLGRCPSGGNGNPLQYSCLENPMDRGDWQGTVRGVAKESDSVACFMNSQSLHQHPPRGHILSVFCRVSLPVPSGGCDCCCPFCLHSSP